MSRHHQQFSAELDRFLQDGAMPSAQSSTDESLFALGRALAQRDASQQSDPQAMYRRLIQQSRNGRRTAQKVPYKRWQRRAHMSVAAASLVVVCMLAFTVSRPSTASHMVSKIVHTVSLGHISYSQIEPAPDNRFLTEAGKQQLTKPRPQEQAPQTLVVTDPAEMNNYTAFPVRLPHYVPDGYAFSRAELYTDEQGQVSQSKYINIYYENETTGKQLFMQQRFADEETAYKGSTTGNVSLIAINDGIDAILIGSHTIDWEADGVLYGISAKGLPQDELIRVASSIQQP